VRWKPEFRKTAHQVKTAKREAAASSSKPIDSFQIHVRIKHACRLLRGDMPCVQLASAAGFADQSHFNRHFKRIMGVTPSASTLSPITSAHLAL